MRKPFLRDSAQSWALFALMTVPFVTISRLSPVGVTWFGLAAGGILCLISFKLPRNDSRVAFAAALSLLAAAGFFVIRGVFAASPAVSLFGTVAQHNGAALWVASACWFLAGMRLADRKALRRAIVLVSGAGVAYGLAAVIEALTSGVQRDWGSVAGVLENSSSLGQLMALTTGVAIAWALLARSAGWRTAAYVAAAFCAAVILLAQSRAGILGLASGTLVALLVHFMPTRRWTPAAFGAAVMAAGAGASKLAVAAATGALGASALDLASGFGNQRDAIWRSGWAAFGSSPFIGRGLEQFSACVSWSFQDGQLLFNGTYDPHNALLAVAIGGGAVGAVLAGMAGGVVLAAMSSAHNSSGRSRAVAALIGGLIAVPASGLVTWWAPVAVIAASYLAGSLIGSVRDADFSAEPSRTLKWPTAVTGLLALALAAYAVPGVISEVRADRMRLEGTATPQALAELTSWPDPTYAGLALNAYLARLGSNGSAVAEATALVDRWDTQRRWHFDLAISSLVFEQAAANVSGENRWSRFEDTVAAGKKADPASAMWDFLGAIEANRLGKPSEAKAYAQRALTFNLEPAEKSAMLDIAGE